MGNLSWDRQRKHDGCAILGAVLSLFLAACSAVTPTPEIPTSSATPSPAIATAVPTEAPEPTPAPQHLFICMTEPDAVSPFVPTQAGNDLSALFYQDAVRSTGYGWEPRLLVHLPSPETGDLSVQPVAVSVGERYVDAFGDVRVNTVGEALTLPQMAVTFTLQSGLKWSDGVAITSRDALLGYHLAQAPEAQGRWKYLAERTARFIALNAQTLRWEGLPGLVGPDGASFLFPLQPAHRWQDQTLRSILQDRTPPANGPFKIVAWESGREVRLEPNPYYSGPAPLLERITVRFPQVNPMQWTELLTGGLCDIILPDPLHTTDWHTWAALGQQGQAIIWADIAPVVLRLDLNLDGRAGAASPLADLRVRQAIARCIDREQLSQALPGELVVPARGFIPPNHPAYVADLDPLAFDPQAGQALLEEAGWHLEEGDSIRHAGEVSGVAAGTPLSLTMHLAPQYFVVAAHLGADLEACGIGILPQPMTPQQLYAGGPEGPLFGRRFELALFGWEVSLPKVCGGWLSDRIPDPAADRYGENFSGFVSEAYDVACLEAMSAYDLDSQGRALQTAEALLHESLPTLFLGWRPFWFVTSPQVRGVRGGASLHGTLWDTEGLAIDAVP